MRRNFDYDVYLCHSSKDKLAVRELAERLSKDGLRVWFDEWEIVPGDRVLQKIQYGLQNSRTLVLFMSPNTFTSEWVELEQEAAIFRNPSNSERRFIPLLLADTEISEMLQPIKYVDWRAKDYKEYELLINALRPPELENPGEGVSQARLPDEPAAMSPGDASLWRGTLERLPAHLLEQPDSRALPLDISTAWGLDRSAFLGLVAGGTTNDAVYTTLVRTEVALWGCLRKAPERPTLPIRWWLRIDPNHPAPEILDQVWDSVEDQKGDRLAYLRQHGVDETLLLGFIVKMPSEIREFPPALLAWSDSLFRLLPSRPTALVFHLSAVDPILLSALAQRLHRHFTHLSTRMDVLTLIPEPEPEAVQLAPLPIHLASLLPDFASRFETRSDGSASEESRTARGMIQSLDAREDKPPGIYRDLLDWVHQNQPSLFLPLLRVGARSSCHQGRRESLVVATRADAWIDAWLAGADLTEPASIIELAAPADPQSGVVVDHLALSLLRRMDRHGETEACLTLFRALSLRLSRELLIVARLRQGELTVDHFLNTSGPREYRLAIRAGLSPWPSRDLLATIDLDRLDIWRLLTALPVNGTRIKDLLELHDPARRAIFGLCTAREWAAVRADKALERFVLEARQRRTLTFPQQAQEIR